MTAVGCRYATRVDECGPCTGPVDQYLITVRSGVETDRAMVCQGHGQALVAALTRAGRAARIPSTYRLVPIQTRCAYGDCAEPRTPGSTLCVTHDDGPGPDDEPHRGR